MIRLLGAITGSALAIASLLLLVGIPQFRADTDDVEREVMTLPLPSAPVEVPETVAEVVEETVEAVTSVIPMAPAAPQEPPVDATAEAAEWTEPDIPPMQETPVAAASTDIVEPEPVAGPFEEPQAIAEFVEPLPATQWYAFWSPFRSEIAASGFVSQLQRVTGLDYRVVKIKPGVYEVAFAYDDDQEIPLNLEQITAATGLRLPEG